MQFFSDDYLMHWGVKGMKWKKKKKPGLPKDITDDAYYEQYPSSWEDSFNMTPEEKKAMREHNKNAKKLRKKYNKERKKVYQTTQKWAKKRGLSGSRRRSTDHFATPKTTGGLYPSSMKPTKKKVYKRGKARAAGEHPWNTPKPHQNFKRYSKQ